MASAIYLQAQLFLKTFPCSNSCVLGTPTGRTERTIHGGLKQVFSYFNTHRPPTIEDAINHLLGRKSLVLNPLMTNGRCAWWGFDKDHLKYTDFTLPRWAKSCLNVCPSKSGWLHAFGVTDDLALPAPLAQELISIWLQRLGLQTDEIFPRHTAQNAPPQGCFI